MDTHRLLVTRVVPSLLAVIVGCLAWGSAHAQLVSKIIASVLASPAAQSTGTKSTMLIPITGTVSALPENIGLAGLAQVRTVAVWDPDFGNPPVVAIDITFLGVAGIGQTTRTLYLTDGFTVEKTRPLAAGDQIEITFPIVPATTTGFRSARHGLATFALSFDPNSGVLTGARGSISASTF